MKLISNTNIEKTKQLIKKSAEKDKLIIVQAQNDVYNRKILEYGKFSILLGVEAGSRKNTLRQIDSGLNHVLAKIAAKNKIALGTDLSEIQKLSKNEKAKRLAKIAQNIKICRKAKCKIVLLNYSDKKDAQNLLLSLGASTSQAGEAII